MTRAEGGGPRPALAGFGPPVDPGRYLNRPKTVDT
jgi:hypothetical protein